MDMLAKELSSKIKNNVELARAYLLRQYQKCELIVESAAERNARLAQEPGVAISAAAVTVRRAEGRTRGVGAKAA